MNHLRLTAAWLKESLDEPKVLSTVLDSFAVIMIYKHAHRQCSIMHMHAVLSRVTHNYFKSSSVQMNLFQKW